MVKLNCFRCKKEILRFPNDVKERNYCSHRCGRLKDRVASPCPTCGKVNYRLPSAKERFCSLRCSRIGVHNPMWREKVGYTALHNRIRRKLPKPKFCENCKGSTPIDLANKSQEYREDISDWKWLCRSCHMVEDGRMSNLLRGSSPNVTRDPKTNRFIHV